MQTEQKLIKRIKKKQDKEAANTLIKKSMHMYIDKQEMKNLQKISHRIFLYRSCKKSQCSIIKKLHFEHGCIGSHRIRYVIIIEARYIVCH